MRLPFDAFGVVWTAKHGGRKLLNQIQKVLGMFSVFAAEVSLNCFEVNRLRFKDEINMEYCLRCRTKLFSRLKQA
jgi:hypothetical protein